MLFDSHRLAYSALERRYVLVSLVYRFKFVLGNIFSHMFAYPLSQPAFFQIRHFCFQFETFVGDFVFCSFNFCTISFANVSAKHMFRHIFSGTPTPITDRYPGRFGSSSIREPALG